MATFRLPRPLSASSAHALVGIAFTLLSSGCLSHQYRVAPAELERIASLPPEGRTRITATQQLSVATHADPSAYSPYRPTGAAADDDAAVWVLWPPVVVVDEPSRHGGGYPQGEHAGGTAPVGHQPASPQVDGATGSHTAATPSVAGAGAGASAASNGGSRHGGTTPSSGSGSSAGSLGKDAAILAVVAIAGAAFIGVALAASEADRFEGTLDIKTDHRLFLRDPSGNPIGWIPIYALDRSNLPPGADALISARDGKLVQVERGPLNRTGASYTVDLGAGPMNRADRSSQLGFAGRFALGVFPTHAFGLYAGLHLTVGAKATTSSAVDTRPFLEAQLWPVDAGALKLGGYAEVGYVLGSDVAGDRTVNMNGLALGGGLGVQLSLATFVALTARAGVLRLDGPDHAVYAPSGTLGLAVY